MSEMSYGFDPTIPTENELGFVDVAVMILIEDFKDISKNFRLDFIRFAFTVAEECMAKAEEFVVVQLPVAGINQTIMLYTYIHNKSFLLLLSYNQNTAEPKISLNQRRWKS